VQLLKTLAKVVALTHPQNIIAHFFQNTAIVKAEENVCASAQPENTAFPAFTSEEQPEKPFQNG
jgi:hypothetical protein